MLKSLWFSDISRVLGMGALVIFGSVIKNHQKYVNHQKYEKLKKDPLAWYCADCTNKIPFFALSNKDFKDFLNTTTTPQPSQVSHKLRKEIKEAMSRFKQVNELFDQSET